MKHAQVNHLFVSKFISLFLLANHFSNSI